MDEHVGSDLSASAAAVYERFFVPALFREPAERIIDAIPLRVNDQVLDIACGTGVLARLAYEKVRTHGGVTGLDRSADMLAVAQQITPDVNWREGDAGALPFEDASFDAVLSQFGLMFFEDRVGALREMARVAKPDGVVAVAVWSKLQMSPGYAAMTELLEKLFGDEVADALRAPFALGDEKIFGDLLEYAGFEAARLEKLDATARFSSLDDWVHTDVKGWTLADMIDDDQFEQLKREAKSALREFVGSDGAVAFPSPALLAVFEKGER